MDWSSNFAEDVIMVEAKDKKQGHEKWRVHLQQWFTFSFIEKAVFCNELMKQG